MSGFSAKWLTLREPYDSRSRTPTVLDAVIAAYKHAAEIKIVDLGCGTGSMLRALAPRLAAKQHWRVIDNDVRLLRHATAHVPANVTLEAIALDLGRDLNAALESAADVVTMSALLDLVSESWIEQLVASVSARAISVYAALSYNGQLELLPHDRLDETIVTAVNLHQRTEKGFGPALGPDAPVLAISRFQSLGYSVIERSSDWMLGLQDRDMQLALLFGWADAARAAGTDVALTAEWLNRRSELVSIGRSLIRVGHIDFFACPRQIGCL